jgi:cytochrome c biogenesis protein CcmG/thiol:disulfide interchange protein DsbE
MGHRLPFLIAVAVLVAGCSGAGSGVGSSTTVSAADPVAAGPLPPVEIATLAGEPTQVTALVEGRVALVSLWATWCDACDKEMEALNRLHESTAERHDAVVIGVAVGEDRAKVAAFTRRRGLRYAQLVDEHYAFADALGQRRLPATLVVDRHGRIVYRGDALDARGLDALRRAIAVP